MPVKIQLLHLKTHDNNRYKTSNNVVHMSLKFIWTNTLHHDCTVHSAQCIAHNKRLPNKKKKTRETSHTKKTKRKKYASHLKKKKKKCSDSQQCHISLYRRRSILCKCWLTRPIQMKCHSCAIYFYGVFIEFASFVVNEMTSPKVKTIYSYAMHVIYPLYTYRTLTL